MSEDLEFRLRARAESHSPEAIILNYLNSKTTLYPPKDMAMIALTSYWLPLAYRDTGSLAEKNLQQVVRDSIYRLKLHLQYLQEMLGEPNNQATEFISAERADRSFLERGQASQLIDTSVVSTVGIDKPALSLNGIGDNPPNGLSKNQPQRSEAEESLDSSPKANGFKPDAPQQEKQEWFNPLSNKRSG